MTKCTSTSSPTTHINHRITIRKRKHHMFLMRSYLYNVSPGAGERAPWVKHLPYKEDQSLNPRICINAWSVWWLAWNPSSDRAFPSKLTSLESQKGELWVQWETLPWNVHWRTIDGNLRLPHRHTWACAPEHMCVNALANMCRCTHRSYTCQKKTWPGTQKLPGYKVYMCAGHA